MLVVCNGMYRSGSTLQHNIANAILSSHGVKNLGFMDTAELAENAAELAQHAQSDGYAVLKTHSALPAISGDFRIIYSHRDLRDVATSIYAKMSCSREKMLALVADGVAVQQALGAGPRSTVLTQGYDVLMTNPTQCITEIAAFLEVPLSEGQADALAVQFSLGAVAAQQPKFGGVRRAILVTNRKLGIGRTLRRLGLSQNVTRWARDTVMASGDGSAFHFNHISAHKGKSGIWREALAKEDAREIESRYGNWLRGLGYAVEDAPE